MGGWSSGFGGTTARDQAPWSDGCTKARHFLWARRFIKSDTSIHTYRGQRYYQQAVQHCTHSSKACYLVKVAMPGPSHLEAVQHCQEHQQSWQTSTLSSIVSSSGRLFSTAHPQLWYDRIRQKSGKRLSVQRKYPAVEIIRAGDCTLEV